MKTFIVTAKCFSAFGGDVVRFEVRAPDIKKAYRIANKEAYRIFDPDNEGWAAVSVVVEQKEVRRHG